MKKALSLALFLGCTASVARQPAALLPLATPAQINAATVAPLDKLSAANGWNAPFEPFRVYGNIHYVGTAAVSAWLITGTRGHVLIDGVIPQSAPLIIANIKKLGFDIRDVKILLNSHAHFDHAGGLAGLQLASGAKMVASATDKPFLEAGDIGHGPSDGMKFPPIRVDRVVRDGEAIALGDVRLKARITPGHSPGCTSWEMQVREGKAPPKIAFFHCSATVAGQTLVPEVYPGIQANFRSTFERVAKMKADIFLGNHNNFFDLQEKRAKQIAGDANAFVDPKELQRFNTLMKVAYEKQLAKELAATF